MKYGKEISTYSVPEWRSYNLEYNEIKKLIKNATYLDPSPSSRKSLLDGLIEQYETVSNSFTFINPYKLFTNKYNQRYLYLSR